MTVFTFETPRRSTSWIKMTNFKIWNYRMASTGPVFYHFFRVDIFTHSWILGSWRWIRLRGIFMFPGDCRRPKAWRKVEEKGASKRDHRRVHWWIIHWKPTRWLQYRGIRGGRAGQQQIGIGKRSSRLIVLFDRIDVRTDKGLSGEKRNLNY